jgi:hypothetical protein
MNKKGVIALMTLLSKEQLLENLALVLIELDLIAVKELKIRNQLKKATKETIEAAKVAADAVTMVENCNNPDSLVSLLKEVGVKTHKAALSAALARDVSNLSTEAHEEHLNAILTLNEAAERVALSLIEDETKESTC